MFYLVFLCHDFSSPEHKFKKWAQIHNECKWSTSGTAANAQELIGMRGQHFKVQCICINCELLWLTRVYTMLVCAF